MRGKTDGFPKKMKSECKKTTRYNILRVRVCVFNNIDKHHYSTTTILFYGLKELSIRVIARGFTTCIGDDG
jgi:hypothetical protein